MEGLKTILTLDDVVGLNELVLVEAENNRRAYEAAKARAGNARGS